MSIIFQLDNKPMQCSTGLFSITWPGVSAGLPLPRPQCHPGMPHRDGHHHPLAILGNHLVLSSKNISRHFIIRVLSCQHIIRWARRCQTTIKPSCQARIRDCRPQLRLCRIWRPSRKLAFYILFYEKSFLKLSSKFFKDILSLMLNNI